MLQMTQKKKNRNTVFCEFSRDDSKMILLSNWGMPNLFFHYI